MLILIQYCLSCLCCRYNTHFFILSIYNFFFVQFYTSIIQNFTLQYVFFTSINVLLFSHVYVVCRYLHRAPENYNKPCVCLSHISI